MKRNPSLMTSQFHNSASLLLCISSLLLAVVILFSACSSAPMDPYPPSGVVQAPAAASPVDTSTHDPSQEESPAPMANLTPLPGPTSAQAAFTLGSQHAQQEWKPDARLTRLESMEGGNKDGTALAWQLNFHSPSRRLEYLAVQISDGQVAFAMQRDSSGPGKPLYTQEWMDSTQAAVLAEPFCSTAEDGTFLYVLDVNLQGGIEWLISCDSGEALHSVRLDATSGDIRLDWFGGLDAEPKP
jgi:hypothetical protein